MDAGGLGRFLMMLGVILLVAGALVAFGPRLPWIGRLPGDFVVGRREVEGLLPARHLAPPLHPPHADPALVVPKVAPATVLSSPPIAPLKRLVQRLERAGVTCALGGSGLLAALGVEREAGAGDEIGDWDLTTDASVDEVRRAIGRSRLQMMGPNGVHADHKIQLRDGEIEIIIGFAILGPAGTVRLPTLVTGRWRGIPIGSPETWAVAYGLLGRYPKAEALFRHLEGRGAGDEARRRLLAEPLPVELSARLRALPPAAPFM